MSTGAKEEDRIVGQDQMFGQPRGCALPQQLLGIIFTPHHSL